MWQELAISLVNMTDHLVPNEWWQWVFVGMLLLFLDLILINVFYLLWLGVAAIIVGAALVVFPGLTSLAQIGIWGLASVGTIAFWIYFLRPFMARKGFDKSEVVGASCVVVRWRDGQGTIRLQRPYGGRDEWDAKSSDQLTAGDQAKVDDFVGSAFVISALATKEK